MRALTADDPAAIGGHRLLARLGAGGMGVVYLARGRGGRLVALKVIRAEHAADPHFRARFRREARLAGGVRGRWAVRVTGADTDAPEPWLATAFVPGPSLAEAVAAHGPLPVPAVLTLGRLLAEALAEVHAGGLVHRDVKPGNVVLGRDGPRLIDFGIARSAAATALTAPDAVIGTPGFLSPEQTRVRGGTVGPASDLFSLGCVLAYAATGRPPFGGGGPAGVLYRTVHEEPELDGLARLPGPARAAVARCLAKEAAARPTAEEVREAFAHRPPDPRVPAPEGPAVRDEDAHGAGDWLPPALLRLVAAHAARALDPPARAAAPARDDGTGRARTALGTAADPARASGPSGDAAGARPASSRRRFLVVGGAAAGVLGAAGAGALTLFARGHGTAAGPPPPEHTVALHGADPEQERGARLAVAAHNARTGAGFRLAVRAVADHGRPAEATEAARRLVADPAVCAVLGPGSAASVHAAAQVYGAVSMPVLLISSTASPDDLARVRSLGVTRAEEALGLPLSVYLTQARPVRRTAVVEDLAGGAAASRLARSIRAQPPGGGTVSGHQTAADSADFGPAVAGALAARAEAVVYAGTSPARAAACARALAGAGFHGARLAVEPVMRAAFLDAAGDAADGWVVSAPYSEPAAMTTAAARSFTAAYRARYGRAPGRWAAEAYDAVNLVAGTLSALGGAGDLTPGQVADRLFRTSAQGVAKPLRFSTDDPTHPLDFTRASFLYGVTGGAFRFLGRADEVTRPPDAAA
ncbi:ABC transporter substrate-binding protein [Streptomyces andamanensis]|uniref:ABC transporter substrate-binding protein n=1 Tax=Streptomyces andamanensis TaxID=1565035 RepID=A0ABV8TJA6_9ACTN